MNDLDETSFYSNDLDGPDVSNGPQENSPGVLATIDHVLQSIPGVIDSWRRPAYSIPSARGGTPTTKTAGMTDSSGIVVMVGLIVGLLWLAS